MAGRSLRCSFIQLMKGPSITRQPISWKAGRGDRLWASGRRPTRARPPPFSGFLFRPLQRVLDLLAPGGGLDAAADRLLEVGPGPFPVSLPQPREPANGIDFRPGHH